jgi:UDP-N-acetylmuramate dehydrogenase
VRRNEPLAKHTTLRIGGPADLWIECADTDMLARVDEVLREEDVPWIVMGKGSNILASDRGVEGAAIVLGEGFKRQRVDGNHIVAGGGVILAVVVQEAFRRGLDGLGFAVGIPGTIGGAVFMNAGSREDWIGAVVGSVTMYVPGTGLVAVQGHEVEWCYRATVFPVEGIIVEATLVLRSGDVDRIRESMELSLERRKLTQPLGMPNAGSVFVNPEGDSAGRLIEAAGLKGTRVGGASVSELHANFIVNSGGATAADFLALIDRIREAVRQTHGVELTPEVRIIGRS